MFFTGHGGDVWQYAGVFEHPVCGLARGADRVAGDPATHAHLSCQGRDAFDAGVAGRGAVVAHVAGLHRDANPKRLSQAGVGLNQVGRHAFGHDHVGAGLDKQRAATGMQVEVNICPAEDMVGHIAGDLLGRQTVVVAGKTRFRLRWSIGEVRRPAFRAGALKLGSKINCPATSLAWICRINSAMTTGPSYSSP